jgi:hypothetical protein
MSSLRLLQSHLNALRSSVVLRRATAVSEDDALGLLGQHRPDTRLQFVPAPLGMSKSRPLCLAKRTSIRSPATSLMGQNPKSAPMQSR